MRRAPCPDCSYRRVNHTLDKVDELNHVLLSLILFHSLWRKIVFLAGDWAIRELTRLGLRLGILRKKPDPDRSELYNRSLIILDEAKKQGISLVPLVNTNGRYTHHFSYEKLGRTYFFDTLPIRLRWRLVDYLLIDDKLRLKRFLQKHGFPHAPGRMFVSKKAGCRYGAAQPFPLVVKPRYGSLSNHVTANIQTKAELYKAIELVKQYKNLYLVEQHVQGDVYRASVVHGAVFAVKRLPPTIRGDGRQTIAQLVQEKNAHPFRASPQEKNATLHAIVIDDRLKEQIARAGFSWQSVVPFRAVIRLGDKVNLSSGGDIEEVTETICAENKKMFLRLSELLHTDILGIDVICSDISRPLADQPSAIIECNSMPYIDMHHFPSIGNPQPVAARIVEHL